MSFSTSGLRSLTQNRAFRRWVVANLFARLPLTMNLLALILVGEAVAGSLGVGAQLAGVATFTSGALAQWRGRMLDRVELRDGLRRDLLLTAVVLAVMAGASVVEAPIAVFYVLAALEGLAFAAVLGGFRALLVPVILDHGGTQEELESANALDAVFVEVAFVAGPAVAGALALAVGALGVVALMAASFLVGAALMGGLPPRPPSAHATVGRSPWRVPGAGSVYALALGCGLALGAFEATIPVRLEVLGFSPEAAGPFLAFTALGSGIAGLIASAQVDALRNVRWKAGILLACFGALFLPVGYAGGAVALAIALFAVGLPIAPLNALGSLVLQRTIPVARQAEGFSLYTAMILVGAGLGQTLAGRLAETLAPHTIMTGDAAIAGALAVVVLAAAVRRRVRGLPQTVGAPPPAVTATGTGLDLAPETS